MSFFGRSFPGAASRASTARDLRRETISRWVGGAVALVAATAVAVTWGYLLVHKPDPGDSPYGVAPAASSGDDTSAEGTDAPVADETDDAEQVLWVGDSLVEGSSTGGSTTGGVGDANFSALVSDYYGWRATLSAVNGTGYVEEPTYGAPERVDAGEDVGVETVILCNGARDLDPVGNPDLLEQLPEAADAVYDAWADAMPDARIVVLGYVTTSAETNQLQVDANRILRRAARAHDFVFIDPSTWFTSSSARRLVGPDGIHATDEGHRYLAMRVAKALERLDPGDWLQPA